MRRPPIRPRPRPKNDLEESDDTPPHECPPEEPESRTLFLVGDVTESSIKTVIHGLFSLSEKSLEPIYLIINTYGGSVDEALALYDAMKIVPAPVRTVGLGKVMSAGCLILAAGEHGHRKMGRQSRMMFHAGYESTGGDIFMHENNLKEFQRTERQYDELVAKETGQSLSKVRALYLPKRLDRYMTAPQCLKFGFIDELAG